jgi:hypothetical protein
MVVLNKKAFKLPRVEKDKFILLMRLGLAYNRDQGTYGINSYNNIEKLCVTIASILNVDKVSFTQTCTICGKDFACQDCKYNDLCETKDMPFQCVCTQCLTEDKTIKE